MACKKVTFAGQAGGLTACYQRWSVPLAGLLSQIALELAGRAGTRLARALARGTIWICHGLVHSNGPLVTLE